jgi:hypothetical protein
VVSEATLCDTTLAGLSPMAWAHAVTKDDPVPVLQPKHVRYVDRYLRDAGRIETLLISTAVQHGKSTTCSVGFSDGPPIYPAFHPLSNEAMMHYERSRCLIIVDRDGEGYEVGLSLVTAPPSAEREPVKSKEFGPLKTFAYDLYLRPT